MPTENEIQMLQAARAAGVTSREEMANFMGQMGHESGGFTRLEEGFRYTRGINQIPVDSARREGDQALEAARLEALEGRPQELARLMYGGRMGNDDAGDGYLYRGRGYTQLTGEENYRNAGTGVSLELIDNPALATDRTNAQQIALWYWENRVPQADRDDVSRATVGINGGTNGLADRLNRYDAWHAVLTPEFIVDLDAGRIVAGNAVQPAVGRPAMEDGALRRLETGDEVRQLNENLNTLNIRADRNRVVPAGQTFGGETEQAIRRFQEQQNLPVTGRADAPTLQAVNHAIEQQRQVVPAEPRLQDIHRLLPERGDRRGQLDQGNAPRGNNPEQQGALITNSAHPDNREFLQMRAMAGPALVKAGRKPNEEEIDNVAAQLLVAKKESPLMREPNAVMPSIATKHAMEGDRLFAIYDLHGSGKSFNFHVNVKTDEAMSTPLEKSTQQLNNLNQEFAMTQNQKLEQQQNQSGFIQQQDGGAAVHSQRIT